MKQEQIRHIWFEKTTPPITVTVETMQLLAAVLLMMSEFNLLYMLHVVNFHFDEFLIMFKKQ